METTKQDDEFEDFQALSIKFKISRDSKALNFSFQIQGHLRTFKFCTNPIIIVFNTSSKSTMSGLRNKVSFGAVYE